MVRELLKKLKALTLRTETEVVGKESGSACGKDCMSSKPGLDSQWDCIKRRCQQNKPKTDLKGMVERMEQRRNINGWDHW